MGTDGRDSFRIIKWTSAEEREQRYKTCMSCDSLVSDKFRVCKECGCFILSISKLADKSCPLGKF